MQIRVTIREKNNEYHERIIECDAFRFDKQSGALVFLDRKGDQERASTIIARGCWHSLDVIDR